MKPVAVRRTAAIFLLFFLTLGVVAPVFASAEAAPDGLLDLPVIRIESEISAEGSDEYEDARVSLLNTTQDFCFDDLEAEWKIHGRSSAVANKISASGIGWICSAWGKRGNGFCLPTITTRPCCETG